MKKIISLVLSAVCAFSLVACGKGKSIHGNNVSSQEAESLMAGVKAKSESLSTENLNKLTYTLKTQMDDETMTTTHKFSKEDNYIYDTVVIENSDVYYGYEDPYKEYIGTIHHSITTNYFYIDTNGKAIDAAHYYADETIKNEETGIFERNVDSDSRYSILAETLEESEKVFHNNLLTQLSDLMTQMLNYSSQMIQTFEPLLEMGSTSMGDMTIEFKSKGEGHLYMKQDMSVYGMYYECEYNDYMLTYMKTVIDNSTTGITATGYNKITTEMYFQIGVCELSYPDLENYTLNSNS